MNEVYTMDDYLMVRARGEFKGARGALAPLLPKSSVKIKTESWKEKRKNMRKKRRNKWT